MSDNDRRCGFFHVKTAAQQQLVDDVVAAVSRAESMGVRPPSHVTLAAEEYDELWEQCGRPDGVMTLFGVEIRRDGGPREFSRCERIWQGKYQCRLAVDHEGPHLSETYAPSGERSWEVTW